MLGEEILFQIERQATNISFNVTLIKNLSQGRAESGPFGLAHKLQSTMFSAFCQWSCSFSELKSVEKPRATHLSVWTKGKNAQAIEILQLNHLPYQVKYIFCGGIRKLPGASIVAVEALSTENVQHICRTIGQCGGHWCCKNVWPPDLGRTTKHLPSRLHRWPWHRPQLPNIRLPHKPLHLKLDTQEISRVCCIWSWDSDVFGLSFQEQIFYVCFWQCHDGACQGLWSREVCCNHCLLDCSLPCTGLQKMLRLHSSHIIGL